MKLITKPIYIHFNLIYKQTKNYKIITPDGNEISFREKVLLNMELSQDSFILTEYNTLSVYRIDW